MFVPCLQVMELMEEYEGKWWIAGGWAIDLHIGEETREHPDIDIAILREQQSFLSSILSGWDLQYVKDQRFIEWQMDDYLEKPIHEIHAINGEGVTLEVLLNEQAKGHWRFRRDPKISYPLSSMNLQSEQGIPYLNPEVVLLYKAKATKHKDHQDFEYVFPYLNDHQKEWLKQALMHHYPDHIWLEKLLY